jgi:acetyltransferase-like isoleucine patch superfamily enzyme
MAKKALDIVGPDYAPVTSSNFAKGPGRWLMLLEFWVVTFIIIISNYYFYSYAYHHNPWLFLLLPLTLWGTPYEFAFGTAIFSYLLLKIFQVLEPPKEGEFPIPSREYTYYCYRFIVCYYAIYFFRGLAIPWADMVAFEMFGIKVGKKVVLYDSWVDFEFVEVGDNVMLSMNAALISHCIYNNKMIVKRVSVGKNAIIGAEAVIAPGVIVEDGAILGVGGSTKIDQRLEGYSTHVGNPAYKVLPIKLGEEKKK